MLRVVRSGFYVLGPETERFEAEFGAFCGAGAGAVGVASGTDALEIALRAVGVSAGAEVITVPNAGGYTTGAVLAIGATPVLVDVDARSLLIDPERCAAAVTSRTAAIVVTHLYGSPASVRSLREWLPPGLPVVEDAAQAHGAVADGQRVGVLGDAAAFSFYPTKNLGAIGDGGAVVSRDRAILDRARMLRQYGWSERYVASVGGGRNSRLDEIQAAVLRVKLPHLTTWNDARRAIARRFLDAVSDRVEFVTRADASNVVHLCVARHPERDALRDRLSALGVGTAVHFPVPDHAQTAFAGRVRVPEPTPCADRACAEVLSLPCFPELTEAELESAISTVREAW